MLEASAKLIGGTYMNSLEIFSNNLRLHCLEHSSIAEVCRQTGINRQQFNKYLSGRGVPNVHTLRRICACLKITESQLLDANPVPEIPLEGRASQRRELITQVSQIFDRLMPEGITTATLDAGELSNGIYFCYFPFHGYDNFILRSVVKIWRDDRHIFFKRITKVASANSIPSVVVSALHSGLVHVTAQDFTLIGRNLLPPYQISVMAFERSKLFGSLNVGISLTRSMTNSIAVRTVLEPKPSTAKLIDIFKLPGIIALNDNSVSAQVRAALTEQSHAAGSSMALPSRDDFILKFSASGA